MRIWARRPVVLRDRHPRRRPRYAPEIDSAVLIGFPAAGEVPGLRRAPVRRSTSARPERPGRDHLASTACWPRRPTRKTRARSTSPSLRHALTAQADAKGALDTLFLGLGAVALLVGAIGVANIMVISVLERRSEIGLRRALGATRGQIRTQFLAEAIMLSLAGGAVGVIIGAAATAVYARDHGEASRHPARGLDRRPGRRRRHRRPGRTAARHPRRPPVANRGTPDRLTADPVTGEE